MRQAQLAGLVVEESVAECRDALTVVCARVPLLFELFLAYASVRPVQRDEQVKGGPPYSLEVSKADWLSCCEKLGVLPAEPKPVVDGGASSTQVIGHTSPPPYLPLACSRMCMCMCMCMWMRMLCVCPCAPVRARA